MTLLRLVALALTAGFLSGCQKDLIFQLDTVTEVKAKSGTTYKEVAGEGESTLEP
ncbi:Hydroxydechloroatrazine ethylaminohydrolase [Shewanella benthica]|uniref:Hydroxydechloroatrazine ethylaminohydrolase n=1 Tax=Shewanella benthica TaxID=43661 RepID=A0A330M0S9_9GAMM|nr:hypothetical protein [Shewanella benthica]SQH75852.1 Hydroxydechloroatrazine ethylaminohydrolase [Shewanella benthica]